MKVPFKKVGDTLSTEDYNAICYLLQQQEYKEVIVLDTTAWHGSYGVYKVQDLESTIARTHDGFRVTNKDNHFSIIIKNEFSTADFYVTLNVMNPKSVKIGGKDIMLYPDDRIDNGFDESLQLKFTELRLKAKHYKDDLYVIDLYPSQNGLSVGTFISKIALFEMDYSKPLINVSDGRLVEDAIICYDFDQLVSIIENAPSNKRTVIQLKGDTTYTFTKEITIDDNKIIYIYGGNTGHPAVLDGQKKYRLFTIKDKSILRIENIDLINGNGSKINKNTDQHKTSGAIYMISQYGNTGDTWTLLAPTVLCFNCRFIDCQANMGGAIYNLRGRLVCEDCEFTNCDAIAPENPSGAYGGAIVNQSVRVYHDNSNQIYLDDSPYSLETGGITSINLNINHSQNLNFFTDGSFALPDMYCCYNGMIRSCEFIREGQFDYTVMLPFHLARNDKIYFFANGFRDLRNLCTRLLVATVDDNNNTILRVVE